MFIGVASFDNNHYVRNYVRWLKESGATPVVIKSPDFDLNQVQGVVWVGGNLECFKPATMRKYLKLLRHMFAHAVAQNDAGIPFPIWGMCLGFQLLATVWSGSVSHAKNFATRKVKLKPSRLATAVRDIKPLFGKFNHRFGVRPPYPPYLTATSELTDADGPFMTSFQFKEYPFYGTTWHPENAPEKGKKFGRRVAEFFLGHIKT
jgi:anthranilate/para-aminobenzoate synthase component II